MNSGYSDGEIKELFLDDVQIEAADHLKRVMHQPKSVQDEPVLRPEFPWEGNHACAHGVIYDPELGRFRMWYQTWYPSAAKDVDKRDGLPTRRPNSSYGVGYAESDDGVHWRRPKLGKVSWDGVDTNLAVRGWGSSSPWGVIFRPDHPNPNERYRLFTWDELCIPGRHAIIGMCTYVSPDGFDWRGLEWDSDNTASYRDPQPFCYVNHVGNYRYPTNVGPGECHGIFWDERINEFVDYCRTNDGSVRAIGRIESDDGIHWTRPDKVLLQPDLTDGHWFQFHSAYPIRCGQSEVLLLHCLDTHKGWTIDCQLATSRDGWTFSRVADRQTFIPNGPETSATAGLVYPWAVVPFGDRWMIYAEARSKGLRTTSSPGTTVLYQMRPDGFVSFHSADIEGSLITRGFTWLHDKIKVNADVRKGGSVHLEVYDATKIKQRVAANLDDAYPQPMQGFSKADCIPLTSDALDHEFKYKNANLSQLRGKYVKIRFCMKSADLYSWTRYRDN